MEERLKRKSYWREKEEERELLEESRNDGKILKEAVGEKREEREGRRCEEKKKRSEDEMKKRVIGWVMRKGQAATIEGGTDVRGDCL